MSENKCLTKHSNYSYTTVMQKQMISLTEPQKEFLQAEAKQLGLSVSELVRRMIDWSIDTYPPVAMIIAIDEKLIATNTGSIN